MSLSTKFKPGQWVYYKKLGPNSRVQVITPEDYDIYMGSTTASNGIIIWTPSVVFYKTRKNKHSYVNEHVLVPYDFGFDNQLQDLLLNDSIEKQSIDLKENTKMAKFTNLGFIGVPKKDANKRYFKLDDKVRSLTVEMQDGSKVELKGGDFLNVQQPRKGKEQSEESYEALKAWKKMELFHVASEG